MTYFFCFLLEAQEIRSQGHLGSYSFPPLLFTVVMYTSFYREKKKKKEVQEVIEKPYCFFHNLS